MENSRKMAKDIYYRAETEFWSRLSACELELINKDLSFFFSDLGIEVVLSDQQNYFVSLNSA